MTESRPPDRAAALAELTDLLQLEADALAAYAVATAQLRRPELREAVRRFSANEWQAREKYARAAARPHAPALAAMLSRHAEDEARHYGWAFDALAGLGCGPETVIGRATQAFARLHGGTADGLEAFGRWWIEGAARAQEPLAWASPRAGGRSAA
jgi:hypothetical protein